MKERSRTRICRISFLRALMPLCLAARGVGANTDLPTLLFVHSFFNRLNCSIVQSHTYESILSN